MGNVNIQEVLDTLEGDCRPQSTIGFSWHAKGIGFGEFVFIWIAEKNRLDMDTECMSKEFIKRMLCQMVDEATDIG